MKRLLFLAIIVLALAAEASAQRPGAPKMDPEKMAIKTVDDLCKTISVSADIQDSLKVVFVNFYSKMEKGRGQGERPNFKEIEQERDAKAKTFLTDKQFTAYQKFMDEQKSKRGEPGRENKPPKD